MLTKLLQLAYHQVVRASDTRIELRRLVIFRVTSEIGADAEALIPAGFLGPAVSDIRDVAKVEIACEKADAICGAFQFHPFVGTIDAKAEERELDVHLAWIGRS